MSKNSPEIQNINLVLAELTKLVDLAFTPEDFKEIQRQGGLTKAYKAALKLPHPLPPEYAMLNLTTALKNLRDIQKSALQRVLQLEQLKSTDKSYKQDQKKALAEIKSAGAEMEDEINSARAFGQRMKFIIMAKEGQLIDAGR